jgi:hypothetical protein
MTAPEEREVSNIRSLAYATYVKVENTRATVLGVSGERVVGA